MSELKIYLSVELDRKFRRIAMSVYGYGRGSLSNAAEEAFERWCVEHETSSPSKGTNIPSKETAEHTKAKTEPGIDPDERKSVEDLERGRGEKNSARAAGSST